jgi:hypothetical protein
MCPVTLWGTGRIRVFSLPGKNRPGGARVLQKPVPGPVRDMLRHHPHHVSVLIIPCGTLPRHPARHLPPARYPSAYLHPLSARYSSAGSLPRHHPGSSDPARHPARYPPAHPHPQSSPANPAARGTGISAGPAPVPKAHGRSLLLR